MKKLTIFGSTGSIGRAALDVVKKNRKEFTILGLCAYKDINTIFSQVKEFLPKYVCIVDEVSALNFKKNIPGGCKLFYGESGLDEFSRITSDISIIAISGISSLKPLMTNIAYTKRIALANKESIVTAGKFVFKEALKYNTEILPIDSEINALFQLFYANNNGKFNSKYLDKIYLTASGGALLGYTTKQLEKVTLKKVLAHPTWKMGLRITVDSATLVNKAFEVIETYYYFNIPFEKIDVIIHRESKIHALVELSDNTVLACLYPNDMRIPIAFSLYYPKRFCFYDGIDFKSKCYFSFQPIRNGHFPLFKLILDAAKKKDNSIVILNASDEVAIEYFLKKKIKFIQIHKLLNYMFKNYPSQKINNIDDVFYWNNWANIKAIEYLKKLC